MQESGGGGGGGGSMKMAHTLQGQYQWKQVGSDTPAHVDTSYSTVACTRHILNPLALRSESME